MSSTVGPDYYGDTVPVYITFSVLSLIATSLVTLVSVSSARVRGDHYSIMVQTITVCDLLFTLKFLVSAIAWAAGRTDARSSFQLFHDNCMSAAAFGVFTGLACISWNAAWIFDFLCVLINPLRNTAAQRRWYHVFVWSLCIFGTVYTLATSGGEKADNHTCLVRGTDNSSLIFEVPLIIYMVLAIGSLIFAAIRLSAGTRTTAILRRRLLVRHAAYVFAFAGFWVWPLIHDFLDKNGTNYSFAMLDAISVSSQAAIFAIIRLSEPGAYAILQRLLRFYGRELVYFLSPVCCCLRYTKYGKKLGLLKHTHNHRHPTNNSSKDSHGNLSHQALRNTPSTGSDDGNSNGNEEPLSRSHDEDENRLLGYVHSQTTDSTLSNDYSSGKGSLFSSLGAVRAGIGGHHTLSGREIRSGSEMALLPSVHNSVPESTTFNSLSNARNNLASPKSPGGGITNTGSELIMDYASSSSSSSSSESYTVLSPNTWLGKLQAIFGNSPSKTSTTTLQEPLLYHSDTTTATTNTGKNTTGNRSTYQSSPSTDEYNDSVSSGTGTVRISIPDSGSTSTLSTITESTATTINPLPKLRINPVSSTDSHLSSVPNSSVSNNRGGNGKKSVTPVKDDDTSDSRSSDSVSDNDENGDEVGDEDGWDLTAGLRTEMGVAMLSGLCQSIATVDRKYTTTGKSLDQPSYLPNQINGLSSELSPQEGFSVTNTPNSTGTNDSYVSVGPSAPEGFRSINQWIRDSTTVTRIVPVTPPEGSFPVPSSITEVLQAEKAEEEERVRNGHHSRKIISPVKRAGANDHVEVASFAEEQFRVLRQATGITPDIIIEAFHPELLVQGMLSAHFSDGASSSFFCRSNDSSMIVKTVNSSEIEVMLRLLPAYMRHLSSNPDSLLARVYGCFSIRVPSSDQLEMLSKGKVIKEAMIIYPHQQPMLDNLGFAPLRIYFILMGNVFPIMQPGPSALVFDLKGSTVNRRARVAKASGPPARHQRHFAPHTSNSTIPNSSSSSSASTATQADNSMDNVLVSDNPPTLSHSSSTSSSTTNSLVSPSVTAISAATNEPVTPPVPPGPKMRLLYQDVEFREAIPHGLPVIDSRIMVKEDTARAPVDEKGNPLPHASFHMTPEMIQQLPGAAMNIYPDLRSGIVRARALVDQLQRDVTLLASQGLMDYSLLIQLIPVSAAEEDDDDDDDDDIHGDENTDGEDGNRENTKGFDVSYIPDSGTPGNHAKRRSADDTDDLDDDGSILSIHGARAIGPRYADRLLRILDARQQKGNTFIPENMNTTGTASNETLAASLRLSSSSSFSTISLQRNISTNSVTNSLPINPISRWSSLSAHVCALGTPKPPPVIQSSYELVPPSSIPPVISPPPYSRRVLVQVGIIDLFQYFNTTKKMELALKSIRHGSLEPDISAVDPHRYAIRFMAFVANVFTPLG